MKLRCLQASALLQRTAAGLSPAEGLRLEEHLASCQGCRQSANMLNGMRALHLAGQPPLSEQARSRAIDAALTATGLGGAAPRPAARERALDVPLRAVGALPAHEPLRAANDAVRPRRHWGRPMLMAAALAACVALGLWGRAQRRPAPDPTSPTVAGSVVPHTPAQRADRVTGGSVEVEAGTLQVGDELARSATIYARGPAQLALAHAAVELREQTRVSWDAGQRELTLRAGSLVADVDPQRHLSFAVITEAFTVQVLGTQFEVTQTSVTVRRGRVRVVGRAGGEPPITLDAAGTAHFALSSAAVSVSASPGPRATAQGNVAPEPSVHTLLETARAQLGSRDIAGARGNLSRVLRLTPSRTQRAEAMSLQAECSLVAGELAAARAGYLRVAARFPTLPAAESALFAASRIEAEHGDPGQAQKLFVRYLARYPHGSFSTEAAKRLRALAAQGSR